MTPIGPDPPEVWREPIVKNILLSLFIALLSLGFTATPVEAKRLGGGSSQGMQRQLPPKQNSTPTPPQNAAPTTPPGAGAAPAQAPRRSWLGPIAGLAAGLGLAALMSHLGLGAQFGEFLMLALLLLAGFMLLKFVMRKFARQSDTGRAPQDMQFAGAGAMGGNVPLGPTGGSGLYQAPANADPAAQRGGAVTLPPGFDAAAFERAAKLIFIRMQAANDAGDLDDLRRFSTPEMFAAFRLDLQDRTGAAQSTDVVQLDARILDVTEGADQQIVSVHFSGLIREEAGGIAHSLDETWHLAQPKNGSREWAIAGIEQNELLH